MPSLFETRTDYTKKAKTDRGKQTKAQSKKMAAIDFTRYQELRCDGCPLLADELQHPKMKATGAKEPIIYITGEAPGKDEDSRGEQFIGKTGRMLRGVLREYLDGCPIRWNNTCRCRPPLNRTPKREEWERCRHSVEADIEKTKPTVLVGVGGVALEWATGEKAITKWRGKFIPIKIGSHKCWFYPILHPSY